MNTPLRGTPLWRSCTAGMLLLVMLVMSTSISATTLVYAQGDDAAAMVASDEIESIMTDEPEPVPEADIPTGIDLLSLIVRGGAFMIPIAIMSLLVVGLSVERMLSLRKQKIMPPELVTDLDALTHPIDRFNPSIALRSCSEHPSPLAAVVSSMMHRTGEPLADVERAANESLQREADRQASAIRWLTLAAAATPLMGLLGTVWGMIMAFHESTTLTADRSRSEQLSEGIYTALVTTLAGLAVAIPAAILALYLENRLLKIFHHVQEMAFGIAPGLSRFAGVKRLDENGNLCAVNGVASDGVAAVSAVTPPPQPPPPPNESVSGNADRGGSSKRSKVDQRSKKVDQRSKVDRR